MKIKKTRITNSSKIVISSLSLLLSGLIGATSLASCWNVAKNNDVIFSIAQSKVFPMAIALKDVVPHYNATQKNTPGFAPVKLITAEDSKLRSESSLLNDTVHKIAARNNNEIPSLILNTNSSASTINSYGRLLDLSDTLKKSDFADDLFPLYNKVAGIQADNSERLYALPYNLSTTESLAVNLPVLKFLVDQAIFHGATLKDDASDNAIKKTTIASTSSETASETEETSISESDIIKSLKAIKTDENINKIQKTTWKRFKYNKKASEEVVTDNNTASTSTTTEPKLKNYEISNDTFKYFDKLMEFTSKIEPILELAEVPSKEGETETKEGVKEKITVSESDPVLNILSIDYANNILNRMIWEKTDSNIDQYIWNYKNVEQKNNTIQVDYTFLKKDENDKSTKFKSAYEEFVKNFKQIDKTKNIRSVLYTHNTNDWGSWLLRTFDTAIGIVPNVGIRQSVQSNLSKFFFSGGDEKVFNSFAKIDEDVKWYHQYTKTSKNSDANNQLETYIAGGSSLIPISVNSKKDTGLKTFLNWIYKGETTINNEQIKVTDWIERLSGYFVPDKTNYGTEESVKNTIKKYKERSEEAKKKNSDEQFTYKSLQLSAEDYLLFLKSKKTTPYQVSDSNKKSPLFNIAGDINTAEISTHISAQIKSMKNGAKVDKDALFNGLINKFNNLNK